MRAAAHFKQLERVAVVRHQDFEWGVVHRRVIDLQGGQGLGVDKNHRQSRDEVRLSNEKQERETFSATITAFISLYVKREGQRKRRGAWRLHTLRRIISVSVKDQTFTRTSGLTLGISMKLGLAVEMRTRVFKEQFTSWERMSHAASADSLLLSTCTSTRQNSHPVLFLQRVLRLQTPLRLTLKLTYCRWLECLLMICLMRSGCVAFR